MKQVGSSGPVGLSGGTGGGMPPPYRRPGRTGGPRKLVVPIVIAIVAIFGANKLLHHENRYEKLATTVTQAIAANDMRPVEKEFNALTREKLRDRGKVGQLSDFVNADGKLKKIVEDTPGNSPAGFHHFVATFEKGQRTEDLTVDTDGKIADFHVRPEAAKP
ncbi:MAG: hypothetical protein NVSMB59_15150 [Vulcanimicrobiaceae bacterium]